MNYIRHLTAFFNRLAEDPNLNPTHISLYISLFQHWNLNRFQNPINISRSELMHTSKICSKATYHKVMKELHAAGYVQYKPSYNPFKGSEVYLVDLEMEADQKIEMKLPTRQTTSKQVPNRQHTKSETSTVPLTEPYINNTNTLNSKQLNEQPNENTNSDCNEWHKDENNSGGAPPSKETPSKNCVAKTTMSMPPSLPQVHQFFIEEKSTTLEAEKFFNYFQSNGWKVGGRAPMKNWHAAARNWILNAALFKPKHPANTTLQQNQHKNYAEPL